MLGRRALLRVLGQSAALAGIGTLTTGCPFAKAPPTGPVPAGNIRSVPVGHFGFVPGQPLVLARDERGVYSMTAICTHWGCDMQGDGKAGADGVRCGCHGSHFDKIGRVLEGPANEPLAHYQVDIEVNGDIYVIAGTKVPSDTRTVVLEAPPPPPL